MYSMYRNLSLYSHGRWKEGDRSQILSHKVKGQPSCDLWISVSFRRNIWRHIDQYYFLLCTNFQDDERKLSGTVLTKCHWSSSVKNDVRKSVIATNLCVLCQVGRVLDRLVINVWWFFVVLEDPFSTKSVIHLNIIQKPRTRVGRAKSSNQPY